MRTCPACNGSIREQIYEYQLTSGYEQRIYSCACGMHYAESDAPPVDYDKESIYATQGAVGSGVSESDKSRFFAIGNRIERLKTGKNLAILDFGCARGGLLDVLRYMGYRNIAGFDPSPVCADATEEKGHIVIRTGETVKKKFDCIVVSHVLEHVLHPREVIRDLMSKINPSGSIYIEVPDALRYAQYASTSPFLDFNSEHINHFDACSLKRLLESVGLFGGIIKERVFKLESGATYPTIWIMAQRSKAAMKMAEFIEKSNAKMKTINAYIERELGDANSVILWGAGEYLAHVLALPSIRNRALMQVIDRSPAGRVVRDAAIQHPEKAGGKLPIIVCSLCAEKSIRADIQRLGLKNKVISLT